MKYYEVVHSYNVAGGHGGERSSESVSGETKVVVVCASKDLAEEVVKEYSLPSHWREAVHSCRVRPDASRYCGELTIREEYNEKKKETSEEEQLKADEAELAAFGDVSVQNDSGRSCRQSSSSGSGWKCMWGWAEIVLPPCRSIFLPLKISPLRLCVHFPPSGQRPALKGRIPLRAENGYCMMKCLALENFIYRICIINR